jgi:hypothetical protein
MIYSRLRRQLWPVQRFTIAWLQSGERAPSASFAGASMTRVSPKSIRHIVVPESTWLASGAASKPHALTCAATTATCRRLLQWRDCGAPVRTCGQCGVVHTFVEKRSTRPIYSRKTSCGWIPDVGAPCHRWANVPGGSYWYSH